jgi:hypothetical protein
MYNLFRDFYSEEDREYKFKIGSIKASALSGFITGVVFTLMVIGGVYLIYWIMGGHLW